MSKHFVIGLVLFSFAQLNGQRIEVRKLDDHFRNVYEISSLLIKDSFLIGTAERCKEVILASNRSLTYSSTLVLHGEADFRSIEIEGIASYKDQVLFLDEAHETVYGAAWPLLKLYEIKGLPANRKSNPVDPDHGLEGIAVNARDKKVYIIREKTGQRSSIIYEFNIRLQDDRVELVFQRETELEHDDNTVRYSDVCYIPPLKKLVLLKSCYYGANSSQNYYQLDTVPLQKDGSVVPGKRKSGALCLVSLTNTVKDNASQYATNLEGLAVLNSTIFIISDNKETPGQSCKSVGRLPLFLALTFP